MLLGYLWSCYDDQSTSSAVLFASPADTEAGGCCDRPVAFCPGKTRTHSRLIPTIIHSTASAAGANWPSYVGVSSRERNVGRRYDTIRDAIWTCARKLTWVSLIYRTEPTTKKCKNRKTKSRKQICPEITVNSPGNPCSKYLSRKKGRATVGKICREGRF